MVKLLPGVLREKRLHGYCTKDIMGFEEMGIMDRTYYLRFLQEKHFAEIVELCDRVFGENYMPLEELEDILKKSTKDNTNCSIVLGLNEGDGRERVIGCRLTYAPGKWLEDYPLETCPEKWGFDPSRVAYMKTNVVAEEFRGNGFGRMLLDRSIAECMRAGAVAAVAHSWMNSPNNSAYRYFSRAGGKLVKVYPNYWNTHLEENVVCSHCGTCCACPASEMIIDFSTHEELKRV